jgi:hypothetical protein
MAYTSYISCSKQLFDNLKNKMGLDYNDVPNIYCAYIYCSNFKYHSNKNYKLWTWCKLNLNVYNIKVGDVIKVEYIPSSQRHIEELNKICVMGKVFYTHIDNTNFSNALLYHDNENERVIQSLERDWYNFFGMSRGYDVIVYKREEIIIY